MFTSTIKTFGINFFTTINKTDFFKILAINLDKEIGPILDKYNESFPETTKSFVNFYVTPWNSKYFNKKFQDIPIDLNILNQFLWIVKETEKEESLFFKNYRSGIESQDRNNYLQQKPAYINSIAMQLILQKNRSGFQMQILGTLNPQRGALDVENDQITFEEFLIPQGEVINIHKKTRILVNLNKNFEKAESLFRANIQFGKLAKTFRGNSKYPYAIELEQYLGKSPSEACRDRKKYAPNLRGLAKVLFDGRIHQNVDFYIFQIKLDPNIIKIQNLDVRLAFPLISRNPFKEFEKFRFGTPHFLDCYVLESVSSKFTKEADALVQEELSKIIAPDDMTDQLLNEVLGDSFGQFTDLF